MLSGCDWCKFPSVGSSTAVSRVWRAGVEVNKQAQPFVAKCNSSRGEAVDPNRHNIFHHSIAFSPKILVLVHLSRADVPLGATEITGDSRTHYISFHACFRLFTLRCSFPVDESACVFVCGPIILVFWLK